GGIRGLSRHHALPMGNGAILAGDDGTPAGNGRPMAEGGVGRPGIDLMVGKSRLNGRRWPRVALGLVLSAVCLWLAVRGVRPAEVAQALGQARLLPLVAAVVIEMANFWAIAARWQALCTPPDVPSRAQLF